MLTVKDEREDALAACGGLRSLTAARAVTPEARAIPPKKLEDPSMNTHSNLSFSPAASAFQGALSIEQVRERAPAVFAPSPHHSRSARYTFIPTERVLTGLVNAGFMPVDARQTHARRASPVHARHVLRLRRRFETVQLKDSIPEVVFLNSHDGTSAYQLRMGLYRVLCTNGLIVSRGCFSAYCVPHRGDVVGAVVRGALELSEQFEKLAEQVEHMEARRLSRDEQIRFAEQALALRYPDLTQSGIQPSQLLAVRRPEDLGEDLFSILNRTQENLLRGGLSRRTAAGRLTRTRGITAIQRDVQLNSGLWDLAAQMLST